MSELTQLRKLIHQDRIRYALERLSNLLLVSHGATEDSNLEDRLNVIEKEELPLIESSYHRLEKQNRVSELAYEEYTQERQLIAQRILDLINQLEENEALRKILEKDQTQLKLARLEGKLSQQRNRNQKQSNMAFLTIFVALLASGGTYLALRWPALQGEEKEPKQFRLDLRDLVITRELQQLADIEIKADVITLDNLDLPDSTGSGRHYHSFRSIRKCLETSYLREAINQPVFTRIDALLDEEKMYPQLRHMLATEPRKQMFLDSSFLALEQRFKPSGVKLYAFPQRQEAFCLVEVDGVDSQCAAQVKPSRNSAPDGKFLPHAISKVTLKDPLEVQPIGDRLVAALFENEQLHFESAHFRWEIEVKRIINPGAWRGGEDIVLVWVHQEPKATDSLGDTQARLPQTIHSRAF